jgi:hypothetical protein
MTEIFEDSGLSRLSDPNLALLEQAVEQLGPLVDRMIVINGYATA